MIRLMWGLFWKLPGGDFSKAGSLPKRFVGDIGCEEMNFISTGYAMIDKDTGVG